MRACLTPICYCFLGSEWRNPCGFSWTCWDFKSSFESSFTSGEGFRRERSEFELRAQLFQIWSVIVSPSLCFLGLFGSPFWSFQWVFRSLRAFPPRSVLDIRSPSGGPVRFVSFCGFRYVIGHVLSRINRWVLYCVSCFFDVFSVLPPGVRDLPLSLVGWLGCGKASFGVLGFRFELLLDPPKSNRRVCRMRKWLLLA